MLTLIAQLILKDKMCKPRRKITWGGGLNISGSLSDFGIPKIFLQISTRSTLDKSSSPTDTRRQTDVGDPRETGAVKKLYGISFNPKNYNYHYAIFRPRLHGQHARNCIFFFFYRNQSCPSFARYNLWLNILEYFQ